MYFVVIKFYYVYVGGLVYYIFIMLKLVDVMLSVYDYLDKDLFYVVMILYDILKIDEIMGVDGEYIIEGLFIGYLVMVSIEVEKVVIILGVEDSEEVFLLKYLIVLYYG